MKPFLISSLLAFFLAFPTWAYAQEDDEDCVYAVDIEDEDMSDYNICGKNSGINKILNDLMDDSAKGSTASKEFKENVEKVAEVKVDWLKSPEALSKRRFELLQLIARECPKGFEVKGEKYAVGPNNALDLQFDYRCN
ncbi:hypothetical protein [Pseudoteredinibacter isoporae]|uniref:Uncharacterized protein n=1 Tax=Pseudoteredinibacter isoporae TaxID=570281 RepID=A0A7X0JVC6_9GAMM|nr:hypothetical protein [Pseudoteredinibacter isoporae]MBB6522847.1 hypothetical protein [Pseudoteredinibacter isoporae]NHO88373.1 hypothetical protein [Pseudoteredinibacter isoporae]NIB23296.1 hypothetical protein [Pseudoteredinibacter isoporae]